MALWEAFPGCEGVLNLVSCRDSCNDVVMIVQEK